MKSQSQNTYPLPDCWLENYEAFADRYKLTRFPYPGCTRVPPKAFANWVKWQLQTTSKECKGLDRTNCKRCKFAGYPEDAVMARLADIVSGADQELSSLLRARAHELGYKPEQPGPNKPGGPEKTPAVAMPEPKSPFKTDVVA